MPMLAAVPALFRELAAAGRFDYWGTTETLTAEHREELVKERQTEVLWWDVIEWDRSVDDIASYDGDGIMRPGLVPFAGDGAGGRFCWYLPWQEGAEAPVVLAIRDQTVSRVFADDLAGTLVRCLVQHFAWHDVEEREIDAATLWSAHRRILDPHLSPEQTEFLDGLTPTQESCQAAEEQLARAAGDRELVPFLQPTRYDLTWMTVADARRLYDQSIAFYEELVAEGHLEFQQQVEETRSNRVAMP